MRGVAERPTQVPDYTETPRRFIEELFPESPREKAEDELRLRYLTWRSVVDLYEMHVALARRADLSDTGLWYISQASASDWFEHRRFEVPELIAHRRFEVPELIAREHLTTIREMRHALAEAQKRNRVLHDQYLRLAAGTPPDSEPNEEDREATIAAIRPAIERELADQRWDFRTVAGLADAIEASVDCVEELVERYPSLIRWVPAVDNHGNLLLVGADRPVSRRERWIRIRYALTKHVT